MNVFICWAEKESLSHDGALLLQRWLPEVLPNLESFVSSEDIASGTLWLQKLFEQLEKSESGILCLTRETLDRNWILFEAGALAKRAGNETGRVCPLLFEFTSLNFPLAAFQAHALVKNDETKSRKEMFFLVKTLNKNRDESVRLNDERLSRQFDRCWNEFWNPYTALCNKHEHARKPQAISKVTNEEILTEMRGAFRQFGDVLTEIRQHAFVVPPLEQTAKLQQLTVQCPFCQGGNEVLMLDRPGETKPTICGSCGGRFNVHLNREHAVLVRGIAPASALSSNSQVQLPSKTETIQCPACGEAQTIELSERAGETRWRICPKCNHRVHVHRTAVGGMRVGGQSNGAINDWTRFLNNTEAWVDSASVNTLVALVIEVSAGNSEGARPTLNDLKKLVSERLGAQKIKIAPATVSNFIKLLLHGGAFQFPQGAKGGWKTPFDNSVNRTLLVQAYARGVVHRLRTEFALTSSEVPELCKLLFPPDTPDAQDAIKQALEDDVNGRNEGLTSDENGQSFP